MSWEIVSRETVEELGGISRKELRSEWYDMVAGMITDYMGVEYLGETATVTEEEHDGLGTRYLFVDYPPIVSVSEVQVGVTSPTTLTSTSYKVYRDHIKLVDTDVTEISSSLDGPVTRFPDGTKNVKITYVSGKATVPQKVKLAAAIMINLLAQHKKASGAVPSLKYNNADVIQGVSPAVLQMASLEGQLRMTMEALLDKEAPKLG